jgi:hypothetical protein
MRADPVLQERRRRALAQVGVATTPVVEGFDVLELVGLRVSSRRGGRAMHPLVLQAVEEALGRGIYPAVALAARLGGDAALGKLGRHHVTRLLATTLAVEDHPSICLPAELGHHQCIGADVGCHARLDRPADDFSLKHVQHHGQVKPALAGVDVDDVARPNSVGRLGLEVARQQVRRDRHQVPAVHRRLEASLVPCPDAVLRPRPPFTQRRRVCSNRPSFLAASTMAIA